ncbi:AbrB family transcriptional regulator [Candidatus Bathyarchaeota archaeon ex4484_205]|nr:MAG: AbrB family transcriptional regulator [Candidatus Bathyarchaeota archaeon ex4484_205]
MREIFIAKVGRRGAIYLPRKVQRKLGIGEGDRVIMRIEDGRIILQFLPDPLTLALKVEKWSETTVEEFEKESEEEQYELQNP